MVVDKYAYFDRFASEDSIELQDIDSVRLYRDEFVDNVPRDSTTLHNVRGRLKELFSLAPDETDTIRYKVLDMYRAYLEAGGDNQPSRHALYSCMIACVHDTECEKSLPVTHNPEIWPTIMPVVQDFLSRIYYQSRCKNCSQPIQAPRPHVR
jgi:hypothetical protein